MPAGTVKWFNPTKGYVHTTRLTLPSMLANKWGRIINIASAHDLVASPYKSAYVAAKHGIVGLTKVTALETAEQTSPAMPSVLATSRRPWSRRRLMAKPGHITSRVKK